MLVLTRKLSERTIILTPSGEEIIIINLGDDRIGIDAPKEVKIFRDELLDKQYQTST